MPAIALRVTSTPYPQDSEEHSRFRQLVIPLAAAVTVFLAVQPAQAASTLTGAFGAISSVSAVSSADVWASGESSNAAGTVFPPLIEHWNGTSWSSVTVPSACDSHTRGPEAVGSIAAVSATAAWAVCGAHILHWNGVKWSVAFTNSAAETAGSGFYAVAASSTSNVWAVGSDSHFFTLTEHWNGTKWTRVKSPNPLDGTVATAHAVLISVTTTSPSSAWATGYGINCVHANCASWTLLHWNGTKWSRPKSPNLGTLVGVSASKASNAWAVSQSVYNTTLHEFVPAIEHWNGSIWARTKTPMPPGSAYTEMHAVAARSAAAWAAGAWGPKGSCSDFTDCSTLIEHWNGTSWSVVPSQNPASTGNNVLYSVAATGAGNAWAGGQYCDTTGCFVLIEHWNGTSWSIA